MKKQVLIIATLTMYACTSIAQNDIDAIRYSQLTFGGTARFAAMAGSMGALGGDISTLSYNPAGIAVFRKTEFTITPSIFSQKTTSTYNNSQADDSKLNFNFGNAGLVAAWDVSGKGRGWETINFGFGYNRSTNFHNRILIEGSNTTSSLLDTYVNNANGSDPSEFDPFSTDLAWQNYLINPDTSGTPYQYNHVITNYGELQRKSVESRGAVGETVVSFGGNYKHRLLIGATIGFVGARYIEEAVYEEIDNADTISGFKSFSFTQNLAARGSGYNFKLGAIVKATDWLRLGASIHTPTTFSFKDEYSSTMKADLETVKYDTASPKGTFDYQITTPFRAMGSVGFIIQKIALLNIDYEYVDYSDARLSSSPNVFANVNSTIRSKYTSASNIRVGGEIRLDPFAIRAGYALYGSPFTSANENKNASRTSYTAGIGFRDNDYFFDFAYVLNQYSEYSYLYDPTLVTPVKSKFQSSSFMFTFGVKF